MSTTFHHSTIDGQTERTNQTMEDILRAWAIDFQGSWKDQLDLIEFHITIAIMRVSRWHLLRHYVNRIVEVQFAQIILVRM